MGCGECGFDRAAHDGRKTVYVSGRGWLEPHEYAVPELVTAQVRIRGKAIHDKLYDDTKAFRDRAVRDAAAKARKVGNW